MTTASDGQGYGLCPTCGKPGIERERRPNGFTMCEDEHRHLSVEFDSMGRKAKADWQGEVRRHTLRADDGTYISVVPTIDFDRVRRELDAVNQERDELAEELAQAKADRCAAQMDAESLPAQSAFDQVVAERDAARRELEEVRKEWDESRAAQRSVISELQQAMCDVFRHLSPSKDRYAPWSEQVMDAIDGITAARDDAIRQRDEAMEGVRWVPCSERMPEVWTTVFASMPCAGVCMAQIRDGQWWGESYAGLFPCRETVTHWMPLPAGPTP